MAGEVAHNAITGDTLYFCRWTLDGDVFLSDGSSSEEWGTDDRDADDYDVAMAENDPDGHYTGDFDSDGNIVLGIYKVAVFLQVGADPADSDVPAIAQGEISWSGSGEITLGTLSAQGGKVLNVYDET
ncbi:MAG TPA: hypothetical protein ENI05_01075 [Porticoccus sp.]|nr:hypothetical protein [Porticoccus sp.]